MPILESIMKKLRDAELSLNAGAFEAAVFEYDAAIEGMLRQYLYKKHRVKVGYNWSKIADDLKEQLGENLNKNDYDLMKSFSELKRVAMRGPAYHEGIYIGTPENANSYRNLAEKLLKKTSSYL